MGKRGGQLNWNRRRLTLQSGDNDVDTAICWPNLGFNVGQPPLDGVDPGNPPGSLGIASRVHVIFCLPTTILGQLLNGEPYFDPSTKTVHVNINNSGAPGMANILFWAPHTDASPGMADTYLAPARPI